MWIFSRYGLFSVVLARKDRGHSAETDSGLVQVRARVRRHLELLAARFDSLKSLEVIETLRADYRFRLIVPRETWVGVAAQLAADVDYPNFKDECHDSAELEDEYIDALHRVWGVGSDLQRRVHGAGAYGQGLSGEDRDAE